MVATGARPAYRKATVGRRWRQFRNKHLNAATHCANCGTAFIRNAPCAHPSHQRMAGCPTHPAYPTLQHPDPLSHGGAARDDNNALAWCHRCNCAEGGTLKATNHKQRRPAPKPLIW